MSSSRDAPAGARPAPLRRPRLSVLGGGPAGLATAHHAGRVGLPFTLYEANGRVGGNCRTLRLGEFLFDTGAHRLHDKDPAVTALVRRLLGDDLLGVDAPSQIFWKGRFLDFPLAPVDLASKLPWRMLARIAAENAGRRLATGGLHGTPRPESFRDLAVRSYGRTLAETFLLGYSEKLWGERTERLSPGIAGGRLEGLDLRSFLREAVLGRGGDSRHLDGSFYYPRHGIGMIFDRLAEEIGHHHIRLDSRITRIRHDGRRIRSFTVDGAGEVEADLVVSTLPLTLVLRLLDPAPPPELLHVAGSMRYRHLRLGVFCLDRPHLTRNASLYFPEADRPYTRIYESKNRSADMAPEDRTAIVVELPCGPEDAAWSMEEGKLERMLVEDLEETGLFREKDVLRFRSYRAPFAYPILEVGFEERAEQILDYLHGFENLRLAGRSARFGYTHIHDMFRMGRDVVEELVESVSPKAAPIQAAVNQHGLPGKSVQLVAGEAVRTLGASRRNH
ncbi:MAG: FAD-dependent oxidoreductase [Gemmatimonadota bacterium]|nr:FAD-dependent oxidoreductase [Gemmatimonadota bacterium]